MFNVPGRFLIQDVALFSIFGKHWKGIMCMKNLAYTAFHGRSMNISPDMRCRFVLPMWMESIIAQKVVSWCEIHFNHW